MRRAALRLAAVILVLGGASLEASAAPRRVEGELDMTARFLARDRPRLPAIAPFVREAPSRDAVLVPVVIELASAPSPADIARLEALGVRVDRGASGKPLGRGAKFAARIPAGRVDAVAGDAKVSRIALDGRPFQAPPPLDLTARMTAVDGVHLQPSGDGHFLSGAGVTICDIDSGIDALHPMFFRPDGGFFEWNDVNQNGVLDPDIDTIDLEEGTFVLRAMNGIVSNLSDDDPLFGTDSPELDLKFDYLYADLNDDRVRNVGSMWGFTEDTPSLGEPLYVVDDVDQDGRIDRGEKLVALGTPKLKTFRLGDKVYRRGENLLDVPWDPTMQHGTGAAGVLAGGQLGYRALTGMAPDADLVIVTDPLAGREFAMTNFCIDEGAKVVLHEYAPWVTFHLDGSSDLEQLIDETVGEGIVHVNPAGNLSGAGKGYKGTIAAQGHKTIPLEVPGNGVSFIILTMLWRDASRPLEFTLKSPAGVTANIPMGLASFETEIQGYAVTGSFDTSDRGTKKLDLYVFPTDAMQPLPEGNWSLEVDDLSSEDETTPVKLFGFVYDDISGWRSGVRFWDGVSEDHLIGWPATADLGLAVAAHTGHPFDGEISGARAHYSGRGRRIDDEPILAISAPDNPIVPGKVQDRALSYKVYGGTSGAGPHVAGAAALMFAHEPRLTAVDVRDRLMQSAVADGFTGTVPNEDFGHGKLDVHRAVFGTPMAHGSPPDLDVDDVEMQVGSLDIPLRISDLDDYASDLQIQIDRDYDGVFEETLSAPTLHVSYDQPGRYVVKLRATDPSGRYDQVLVHVDVLGDENDVEPSNDDGSTVLLGGGGGCTVHGAPRSSSAWLGAGLLATIAGLVSARRRFKK
ncbi:MAG: S8 family serine peptidase [Polyangiaceae bacterium]|nr:S8 family serine peptidase [Polyangiaceae bacterium]